MAETEARDTGKSPSGWRILRIALWLLIADIFLVSFLAGLKIRRWTWEVADPIRFVTDIHRGCFWGLVASGPEGYLNQYEKMAIEKPEWDPWLDYAPLRLLVMQRWGAWLRVHYPPDPTLSLQDAWQRPYEYTAPVLTFNTAMDFLAATCAFFLTRLWVRRGSDPDQLTQFHGVWQGVAAALLLWFNPAMILSAHGWPTWDAWIVAFYLLATLLASLDWWFCAGLTLAIGTMFKGQQLTMVPIFLVWPLMQNKPGAVFRSAAGMVFAFAAIASPWLLSYLPPDKLAAARQIQNGLTADRYPPDLFAIPRIIDWPGMTWVAGLIAAVVAASWIATRPKWWKVCAGAGVFALTFWPWLLERNRDQWLIGIVCAVVLTASILLIQRRHFPHILAMTTGLALLMCMDLFHGSTAWWDCSFHFGTIHWPNLMNGRTSNLPGLLHERYDWLFPAAEPAFTLPAVNGWWQSQDISSRTFFDTIYAVLLAVSAIGVGLQARRQDRRILVALVTPWLVFFTFPVQIHERYLLFGAGVSAICIGQSVGMALLGLFVTFMAWVMSIHVMMAHGDVMAFGRNLADQFPWLLSPGCGDTIYKYIDGTHPDIAWGLFVTVGVFLWISVTPTVRGGKRPQ